jgi:hypothetical protein
MSHDHPSAGDPEYDGFRITSVWAFTLVDPRDNQEGIPAVGNMPLIASDRVRLDDLTPYAQSIADALGVEVKLRRFEFSEDVAVLTPRKKA